MFSVLLPWMSYGVGSKTGLDIAGLSKYFILFSGVLLLFFSYIFFKIKKQDKITFYFSFLSALVLFFSYLYELIRIAYQATIAKSLPVEMFGFTTLAANQIHIGYGLYLGTLISFLPCLIRFFELKFTLNKNK